MARFLIVTNKTDLTSDFIVREMRNRSLEILRINTEDISQMRITYDVQHGTTIYPSDDCKVELKQVQAAYFRRPLLPDVSNHNMAASSARYVREEWGYMLRSIYLELDNKWFSHPNKIILAEDKPKQLRLAQEIGFSVPDTVITNDVNFLGSLFRNGEVVAKPLKHALLEEDNIADSRVIFTTTIKSIEEIDKNALQVSPVIFQRKINKQFDIRVTVVEDNVFPVAIKSQAFEKTKTDWRHSSVVELEHEIFELPSDIADYCKKLVRKLDLRFGAIDLVLDENNKFWFLECNPNGQWAWIENRTGAPIAAAIVNSMERMQNE